MKWISKLASVLVVLASKTINLAVTIVVLFAVIVAVIAVRDFLRAGLAISDGERPP